jgi:hypothetical protein
LPGDGDRAIPLEFFALTLRWSFGGAFFVGLTTGAAMVKSRGSVKATGVPAPMPHDVFSKRGKPLPDVFEYDKLPQRLRQQIAFIYDDSLGKLKHSLYAHPLSFFDDIKNPVVRAHGIPHLRREMAYSFDAIRDCILESQQIDVVLDVIERFVAAISALTPESFQIDGGWATYTGISCEETASEINYCFRENGIGYQFDVNCRKLIRVDSLLLHATVTQPVLLLLSHADYKVPNDEFVAALDEYKNGKYAEAITQAGSAYESVMKVILTKKGWLPTKVTGAGSLIAALVCNSGLEDGYRKALSAAADVRNLASSAHGGGTTARVAEEHHCQLTLNLAASAMLYLVEEFG